LFVSIMGIFKYRAYIKRDLTQVTYKYLFLQTTIGFLLFVIPGLLLVRWYYKMKDK
jgi:hypothetical protein